MPWVKLSDDFFDNLKVVRAGPAARMLYLAGLCFCARKLTDGFIPQEQLPRLGADSGVSDIEVAAARLVEVNLWEIAEAGYQVHDWREYNPPAEKVMAERAENRQRQKDWQNEHRNGQGRYSAEPNSVSNTVTTEPLTGAITAAPVSRIPYPVPNNPELEPFVAAATPRPKESKPVRILFGEATDAFKLAAHLRSRILENNPGAKVPPDSPVGLASWSAGVDAILRIDKRQPAEVRRVIDWCQQDGFWRSNILSPPTLRRQYDRLVLKTREQVGRTNGYAKPTQEVIPDDRRRTIERLFNQSPGEPDGAAWGPSPPA